MRLTRGRSDQDETKEEREEGNPVLPDGLWCIRYRYADAHALTFSGGALIYAILGRTTFVNTLCGRKVLEGKDADDANNAHLEEGVRIKPITVGEHEHASVQLFDN